ncbi:MAG: hypothetical protein U0401_34740 [Anaerolineae bacterium]
MPYCWRAHAQEFLTRIKVVDLASKFLFAREGLSIAGAITIFVLFAVLNVLWTTQVTKTVKSVSLQAVGGF